MAEYPEINKSRAQRARNLTYKAGRSVQWIVHHYTATNASAENNCIYFGREQVGASADFFIDLDGTIWQFNADLRNYYSWHCGCSSSYTKRVYNSNSIGIEMVGTGGEFTQAQKESLRALTLALMEDFGIDASHVVRHYDCNTVHKLCPFAYCGSAAKDRKWAELHAYVTNMEGDWLDMATMKEVQQAVWGYRNEGLESVDAYQILRDTRDAVTGGVGSWAYRNEGLEEVDAYQIMRDVRDEVVALRKEVAELKKAVG